MRRSAGPLGLHSLSARTAHPAAAPSRHLPSSVARASASIASTPVGSLHASRGAPSESRPTATLGETVARIPDAPSGNHRTSPGARPAAIHRASCPSSRISSGADPRGAICTGATGN